MSEIGTGSGSSYPAALDTNDTAEVNSPNAGKTKARAEVVNDLAAAIVAAQTELGINPAGTLTDVKTFLQTEHALDGTHTFGQMADKFNEKRAKFTYNGSVTAYTIKLSAAQYYCTDKFCWWGQELTTSAIGSPIASTWYYLYLDYSEITSKTEITSSELIWATTAPTWSETYRAWMNGSDRCIFAAKTNSGPSDILDFWCEKDLIFFATSIVELSLTDIDTTWTSVSLEIPTFCTYAVVTFSSVYVDSSSTLCWKKTGITATGHPVLTVNSSAGRGRNTLSIATDTNQNIDIKHLESNGNTSGVETDGWYLPEGM